MASTSPQADGPKRKRNTWDLEAANYEMILADQKRMCLRSANAALNADLAELREWRSGVRRYYDAARGAGAGR